MDLAVPDRAAARALIEGEWRRLALAQRWSDRAAAAILAEVLAAYGGAGRHYHDLRHIAVLLQLAGLGTTARTVVRPLTGAGIDLVAFDLAILAHDLVYDPAASDNEERSAERGAEWCVELGLSLETGTRVRRYVLATKHLAPALDHPAPDELYFADLDLAILAAPPAVYRDYVCDVRKEYAAVPEPLWRAGRAAVLRRFVAEPQLYRGYGALTSVPATWEARARANLAAEIAALGQG